MLKFYILIKKIYYNLTCETRALNVTPARSFLSCVLPANDDVTANAVSHALSDLSPNPINSKLIRFIC